MAKNDNGTIYLGDGLYAEFADDQIKLFSHDGIRELSAVYLDVGVLVSFDLWTDNLRERGVLPPRRT